MTRLAEEIKQTKPFSGPQEEMALQVLRTADLLNRQMTEFLKPHGLSPTQYNALRILRGSGAEGLPCGEVSSRMVTREPDVTRLLDRMERQEWIERRRQSHDRRVVKAWLAPAGAALLKKIDRQLADFQKRQFCHMAIQECRQIIGLMEKLREATP